MPSSKEYLTYVLELLREVRGISYKKMMGEYVIYKDDVVVGGIYDNRFLVKKTPASEEYELKEIIPYPSSKGLYLGIWTGILGCSTAEMKVINTYYILSIFL